MNLQQDKDMTELEVPSSNTIQWMVFPIAFVDYWKSNLCESIVLKSSNLKSTMLLFFRIQSYKGCQKILSLCRACLEYLKSRHSAKCLGQIFDYIIVLGSTCVRIKDGLSKCTLRWAKNCIRNRLFNLKSIRRRSGCRRFLRWHIINFIFWRRVIALEPSIKEN